MVEIKRAKPIQDLIEAAKDFVAKVECGKAHSVKSYAKFKDALIALEEYDDTNFKGANNNVQD